MKKLFVLVPIILLLSSCNIDIEDGFRNIRTRQLDILTSEESVKIKQMSNDIIDCIKWQDKEALNALFCEQVRSTPDFDKEISEFIEYIKCHSLNWSIIKETAGGGESIEAGKRTAWYVRPEITYLKVVTESDAENWDYSYYSIYYYWQIIDESDKAREGLHYINIELLNISSLFIGNNPFG